MVHPPVNRISGTVRLAKLLSHFGASPKLSLSGLKKLKLTYAFGNDHFGARSVQTFCIWILITNSLPHSHFVRQNLPKIRFDNPNLDIEVERVRKTKEERWRPEIELEFGEWFFYCLAAFEPCTHVHRDLNEPNSSFILFRGWQDNISKFA